MAKKTENTESKTARLFGTQRPTPEQAEAVAAAAAAKASEPEEKKGPGRPKEKTQEEEDRMKRTSVSMDRDQMAQLKIAASLEQRPAYEIMGEAIQTYLDKKHPDLSGIKAKPLRKKKK